jgi:putative colanic acid biosynthesis UDP-glucose lipid carrier transferase
MAKQSGNYKTNTNERSEGLINALKFSNFLWVALSAILVYWWQFGDLDVPADYTIIILIFSFLSSQFFKSSRVYLFNQNRPFWLSVKRVFFAWTKTILVLTLVIFLGNLSRETQDHLLITVLSFGHIGYGISRLWVTNWLLAGLCGLFLLQIGYYLIQDSYKKKGQLTIRAVIVGAEHTGRWVVGHFNKAEYFDRKAKNLIQIIGIYDDRVDFARPSMRLLNMQSMAIRGGLNDLFTFVHENPVDMVIVTLPYQDADRIHQVVKRLRVLPVQIHVCPGRISYDLDKSEVVDLVGIPMLKIIGRPLEKGGWLIKQIEDLVVASLAVLLVGPLMLLIALVIKLESQGPVIYTQQRGGFNSAGFKLYKFRTMRYDPDAPLVQAQPQDPRITKIGHFLRKHSLDELPQFFNVLKGDMSVVGPRPHAIAHDQEFSAIIAQYVSRLRVKPGITGWAQVNGFRGLTDTQEKLLKRLEYDLYYIDNWSVWLDLWIILKTFFISMKDKNAF